MKQIRLLVYGEGPDDYGWRDSKGEWCSGSIISILKKCAEEMNIDLDIDYVEKRFVDGKDKIKLAARHLRKVEGKGIPALRFSMHAIENGYTEGIFYCDTDKVMSGSQKDETHCRKHFEKIHSDVVNGLQAAESTVWRGIPMISLKMIENWLLADKESYRKCFGAAPSNPSLPSKPELIWGEKNNLSSDYPKNYIKRVLEQYYQKPGREIYRNIADEVSIETLRKKCPISFCRFYEDFAGLCETA